MTRHIIPWTSANMLDRFFDDALIADGFAPAIDVYQDKDNVIVEAAITGIKPEDVEVTVENDVLTIAGATEEKSEVKREDYYRKEIRSGSFSRSVILPMRVKGDAAEAHYEKGVLKIVIPKAEEVKPKKIAVRVK